MWLVIAYLIFLAIGGLVCFGAGWIGDSYDSTTGMFVFLFLFFVNLWVSWRAAILVTEPRKADA